MSRCLSCRKSRSSPEAFDLLYYFERACETLITAYSTGKPLRVVSHEVAELTAQQWVDYKEGPLNHLREIKAILESEAFADESAEANQTGDNFVLTAVIMASVLFFAGISTKFSGYWVRVTLVVLAFLAFLSGTVLLLTFPVQ